MGNIDSLASNLTAIGNAIREKTGKSNLLTLDQMPTEIRSISYVQGYVPTDEDLTFKENSQNLFAYDNYNWLLENYADRIKCGIQRGYTFYRCTDLREIPIIIFKNNNIGIFSYSFAYCYILDKLEDIDINTYSGGCSITSPFGYCACLRDIMFKTNDDGTPFVYDASKNIYFSKIEIHTVGYVDGSSTSESYKIVSNKFGLSKKVTDDASYQALKNDPDWWTDNIKYSKYNHDSAVRTINSLPDVSSGSTRSVISFKKDLGSLTDGGAVSTLTAQEIAVATAKGWTVTLA